MEPLVKINLEMEREYEDYRKKGDIRGAEVVGRMITIVERQIRELSPMQKD